MTEEQLRSLRTDLMCVLKKHNVSIEIGCDFAGGGGIEGERLDVVFRETGNVVAEMGSEISGDSINLREPRKS